MSVAVRFAPSPTGRLHVGNARMALINWLFARGRGGRFILRLDDTDRERSTDAAAAAIEEDLAWLGLGWDDLVKQSERLDRYRAAADRLRASGRLYPCYETAEELEIKRRRQLAAGRPPIYDRAALELKEDERKRLETEGLRPHWRFLLEPGEIAWDDLVRGPVRFDSANLSDPVLVRADGRPLYGLSSVVDDMEFDITHVIRGEDHVANTAVQVQVFGALGGAPPAFAHLPLLTGAGGAGLSKRLAGLGLEALRGDGIEPMAVNSLLARLGTADPVEPRLRLDELKAGFDLARFSRATPGFDPAELQHLNARLLHMMPYDAARARLEEMGLDGIDERFWLAVRPNLGRLADTREWSQVCRGPLKPVIEDSGFAREAAELLPEAPWDEATFGAWAGALEAATGRKGRVLIRPLRLALTGREHGPELKYLLPIIGRERAVARLAGKTA
ncbi:MAG: glutamate--tRNA ligase [Alphaproteobacteria bacterium]